MELGESNAQDHSSRSRVLGNLELNVELDSVMEGEDLEGNIEDYATYKEGADVDSPIMS